MGWSLQQSGSTPFGLPNEGIAHIVNSHEDKVAVVHTLPPQAAHTELAQIDIGPFGAKLEAIHDVVNILPGHTHTGLLALSTVGVAVDIRTRFYELQPRTNEHFQVIFLRPGDILNFPKIAASVTCQWTDPEVQVNSSATDAVQVANSADANAIAETPEEGTEDEDLDNTMTIAPPNQNKSQPRATPALTNQRSIVVHETPTAARINETLEYSEADADAPKFVNNSAEAVEDTPSSSPAHAGQDEPEQQAEAYSTARTGESQDRPSARGLPGDKKTRSSPQVQIPPKSNRKRPTPLAEEGDVESESEVVFRASKRTKRNEDDTQDSRMSSIEVDVAPPRKTTAKSKKQQVVKTEAVDEAEDATPTRSQRSSQRSTTPISAEAYDGPTPRVAFSNSAVTNTGFAVKFLKKQHGTSVENLTDGFNVLCVKDGELRKTSKVLLAVAQGIPIVTDKWLLDSAKATHFLSVSAYKLSASKQEKQWKLKLDDVWGQPQTPFQGCTIHFTKSLKGSYHPFTEIEAVCKAAGAKSITSSRMNKTGDTIVLALDEDDAEAQKLMQDGVTCYHRDLITYSILRGSLDLESDEFRIAAAPKEKKRKGRKST